MGDLGFYSIGNRYNDFSGGSKIKQYFENLSISDSLIPLDFKKPVSFSS